MPGGEEIGAFAYPPSKFQTQLELASSTDVASERCADAAPGPFETWRSCNEARTELECFGVFFPALFVMLVDWVVTYGKGSGPFG